MQEIDKLLLMVGKYVYSVNPTQTLILSNMYHVPNLSVNLISVDIIHSDVWGMLPLLAD